MAWKLSNKQIPKVQPHRLKKNRVFVFSGVYILAPRGPHYILLSQSPGSQCIMGDWESRKWNQKSEPGSWGKAGMRKTGSQLLRVHGNQESVHLSPCLPPLYLPMVCARYKGEVGDSQNCLQFGKMKLIYKEIEEEMGHGHKLKSGQGEQNWAEKHVRARNSQRQCQGPNQTDLRASTRLCLTPLSTCIGFNCHPLVSGWLCCLPVLPVPALPTPTICYPESNQSDLLKTQLNPRMAGNIYKSFLW